MPELSIVIPTFNTAEMTLAGCHAVLASMPDSTEIIVADDGSTDGTSQLLAREAPTVRLVRLEQNRGFAPAANAGVRATTGRIILLLNSDAVPKPGALEALLAAFEADPKLGVASAALLNADGSPQWSGGAMPTLAWMIGVVSGAGHLARHFRRRGVAAAARTIDWVSGAAMAIRRETWDAAGPLDERFRFYCQDIELCYRARESGWSVRIVTEAEVVHGLGLTAVREGELRHDPERLWPDLLEWGSMHYGMSWTRLARATLVAVAWGRIALRSLGARDGSTAKLARAAGALGEVIGPRNPRKS